MNKENTSKLWKLYRKLAIIYGIRGTRYFTLATIQSYNQKEITVVEVENEYRKTIPELYQVKIEQTITPILFKDEAINKVKKQNIEFGKRIYIFIPFIVSKDSHQKDMRKYSNIIEDSIRGYLQSKV